MGNVAGIIKLGFDFGQFPTTRDFYMYRKKHLSITGILWVSTEPKINQFGELYTPKVPLLIHLN